MIKKTQHIFFKYLDLWLWMKKSKEKTILKGVEEQILNFFYCFRVVNENIPQKTL